MLQSAVAPAAGIAHHKPPQSQTAHGHANTDDLNHQGAHKPPTLPHNHNNNSSNNNSHGQGHGDTSSSHHVTALPAIHNNNGSHPHPSHNNSSRVHSAHKVDDDSDDLRLRTIPVEPRRASTSNGIRHQTPPRDRGTAGSGGHNALFSSPPDNHSVLHSNAARPPSRSTSPALSTLPALPSVASSSAADHNSVTAVLTGRDKDSEPENDLKSRTPRPTTSGANSSSSSSSSSGLAAALARSTNQTKHEGDDQDQYKNSLAQLKLQNELARSTQMLNSYFSRHPIEHDVVTPFGILFYKFMKTANRTENTSEMIQVDVFLLDNPMLVAKIPTRVSVFEVNVCDHENRVLAKSYFSYPDIVKYLHDDIAKCRDEFQRCVNNKDIKDLGSLVCDA
jgi:hypothetical protein